MFIFIFLYKGESEKATSASKYFVVFDRKNNRIPINIVTHPRFILQLSTWYVCNRATRTYEAGAVLCFVGRSMLHSAAKGLFSRKGYVMG